MAHKSSMRDATLARGLLDAIEKNLGRTPGRGVRIMEVCGTHTVEIFRSGIRSMLPEGIDLISGPGCPVCVTPQGYLDAVIDLASKGEVTITTFGDMVRVPGTDSSLDRERAAGADVRVVYSAVDALEIANEVAPREVVFLGVGFETTTPTVAGVVLEASEKNLGNFTVFAAHKLVVPAMNALLADHDTEIDAFLCPGHVSAVIGSNAYREVAERFGKPCVVGGFEPLDVLQAVYMITRQVAEGRSEVENQYTRVVRPEGNIVSMRIMESVFEPADTDWRGLGVIPGSGMAHKEEFADFDAARRFDLSVPEVAPDPRCCCGDVLKGLKTPPQCGMFARSCTPAEPFGPCMVSSEGACSAYYKYGREK